MPLGVIGACSASQTGVHGFSNGNGGSASTGSLGSGGAGGSGVGGNGGQGGSIITLFEGGFDGPGCELSCSADSALGGRLQRQRGQPCSGTDGCDATTMTCANACQAAINNKQSVGCEYYATDMDQYEPGVCFAAFVANTWNTPAHISVDFAGATLPPPTSRASPSAARRHAHLHRRTTRARASRRARSRSSSSPGAPGSGVQCPIADRDADGRADRPGTAASATRSTSPPTCPWSPTRSTPTAAAAPRSRARPCCSRPARGT